MTHSYQTALQHEGMRSILIVEDNESIALGLRASLQVEGHTVDTVGGGREALERMAITEPDLIILELVLGEMSGFEVLRRVRERGFNAMVLVLSALSQEADKVQALRLGADGYIVKPVGVLEIIARVDALFRRAGTGKATAGAMPGEIEWRFGNIAVDTARRTIRRGDALVDVRPMEFDLLLHLLKADGRVVSRHALMQHVWHYAPGIATRTVDQHVGRLRQKLEDDPTAPRHIITVRKAGYRILF